MPTIPTTEPSRLVAGDTLKFQRTLPDYPADQGWSLVWTLVSATSVYSVVSTANGASHLVTAAAGVTSGWTAGQYTWRTQAAKAGEVYTVGSGSLTIEPAFASATDARSMARRALDAVEAYLADPNNIAASQYQIAGRELRKYDLADLWAHRDRLQMEVQREQAAQLAAAGLPDRRRVFVRFGA